MIRLLDSYKTHRRQKIPKSPQIVNKNVTVLLIQCLDLKENIQFVEIKSIKLFYDYWGATLFVYGKSTLWSNILADR